MEKYGKYFLPCTDRIASVSMFNQGRDAWCADAACASVPCPDCILCCNNGDSASKIKAFGDWAVSEGYKVTRPEYLAMTSDSHAVIESSDTDDADEDECTCTCKYCEKQFSSDDEYTDLCPDCQTDYDNGDIRQCTRCRCYLNTDDGCYIEDSGEWYCHDCAESRAHHCDDCGEWYLYYHNVQTDDYRCICNRCYERHDYYTCDSCGMILDDDDVYWHSDTSYCESCCPSGVINEYGYSPEPCFSSTNRDDEDGDPIYLGFELEAGDAEACDRDDVAEEIVDMTDLCYLKEDCSIPNYGFELVTHPCTYLYHKDEAPWQDIVAKMSAVGLKSHDASKSCGLHVHVNRDALTDTQWVIVDWMVHRHRVIWEGIARRASNSYAEFKSKNHNQKLKDVYGKGWGRYTAINFSNRNTVEFRLFRGTLRYETLIGTLCLVDGLIRWARQVHAHDILQNGAWGDFINFVKADERFKEGLEYLKYRNIID